MPTDFDRSPFLVIWEATRACALACLHCRADAIPWMAALSTLLLVVAIAASGGEHVSPIWPTLYFGGLGLAFLFCWPTVLALVSRAAPASVNATMMGVAFLSLFVASLVMGRLGALYESMGPTAFWALHAAIAACGGVAVLAVEVPISRALAGDVGEIARGAAGAYNPNSP